MYHPKVIEARRKQFENKLGYELVEYSPKQSQDLAAYLASVWNPEEKKLYRDLTAEESRFIQNELAISKFNFGYWCERYAVINKQREFTGPELSPMYPLMESQQLILAKLAKIELDIFEGRRDDGILYNLLKARQIGGSTLAQTMNAHRIVTQNNIFGLVAADVPKQSAFLFDIFERVIENLPWWMKPEIEIHVKDSEMLLKGGSHIWVASGQSKRGTEGDRGQLGRGQTLSLVHLSELSTWDLTSQIDSALLATMHPSMRLLGGFESTAKGRGNWWHNQWQATKDKKTRFINIFIPWFAETRYSRHAPIDWSPSNSTVAHARRCEETGPRWLDGPVSLTRNQLFWYESKRAEFEAKDDLGTFLEEYAADDEECFQFGGRSIFSVQVQQRVRDQAKPILAVLEVAPSRELIEATIPLSLEIPKGYGIKKVLKETWSTWEQAEFMDHVVVWELPNPRKNLYVMPADISDGIGKARSVIDIIRVGTVESPEEQVAQFISDTIDPTDLAAIMECMGKFYTGVDNMPALAAPEVNNHGIATLSELNRHLNYDNIFIWQHEDAANPLNRFTRKLGWYTNITTRRLIIIKLVKRVKTVDKNTGIPDFRINSPFTIAEMQDFVTPPDGSLGEARAANDAYDDCLLTAAIGIQVAETLQEDTGETLAEARKRRQEQKARLADQAQRDGHPRDFQNTDHSDLWDDNDVYSQ